MWFSAFLLHFTFLILHSLYDWLQIRCAAALHLFDLRLKNLEMKFEEDAPFVVELEAFLKILPGFIFIASQQICESAPGVSHRSGAGARAQSDAFIKIRDGILQIAF